MEHCRGEQLDPWQAGIVRLHDKSEGLDDQKQADTVQRSRSVDVLQ